MNVAPVAGGGKTRESRNHYLERIVLILVHIIEFDHSMVHSIELNHNTSKQVRVKQEGNGPIIPASTRAMRNRHGNLQTTPLMERELRNIPF